MLVSDTATQNYDAQARIDVTTALRNTMVIAAKRRPSVATVKVIIALAVGNVQYTEKKQPS